jgi:hypothetical protein
MVLQITAPNTGQGRALPTSLAQTRATNDVARIRVEISGVGIDSPIVVECLITGPATPECQITINPTTIVAVITVSVPRGTRRQVAITAFDQNGVIILSGQKLVDLTQPIQTVNLSVNPQTGTIGITLALLMQADNPGDATGAMGWALLSQPPDSQATVSDTGGQPTFVLDRPGIYVFQLAVSENQLADGDVPVVLTTESPSVTWTLLAQPPESVASLTTAAALAPVLLVDMPGSYIVQAVVAN